MMMMMMKMMMMMMKMKMMMMMMMRRRRRRIGPHTTNAANVGSSRDLIYPKNKHV